MRAQSVISALALAGSFAAQGQSPSLQDKLMNTNFSQLNQVDCETARQEMLNSTMPVPYGGAVWEETNPKRRSWFNSAVSDGQYSPDITKRTIYCQQTSSLDLSIYRREIPKLYCDGTENANGLKIQPVPTWVGNNHCQTLETFGAPTQPNNLINFQTIKKLCGCKNQPPTPPPNAKLAMQSS